MRSISSIFYFLLALVAISTTVPGFAQERDIGGLGLAVYTDTNFCGAIATLRQDEPDLGRVELRRPLRHLGPERARPGCFWAGGSCRLRASATSQSTVR